MNSNKIDVIRTRFINILKWLGISSFNKEILVKLAVNTSDASKSSFIKSKYFCDDLYEASICMSEFLTQEEPEIAASYYTRLNNALHSLEYALKSFSTYEIDDLSEKLSMSLN
jgi:hypothetical protein